MNMDDNSLSHIHLTKDEMLKPCKWKGNLDLLNIVLIGITNEIPEHDEKYGNAPPDWGFAFRVN